MSATTPSYKRSFDTYSWQREIRRRASASGAGIEFKPGIPTAYTDGRMVYVPSPPKDPTYDDFQVIRGMVIHEVGHLIRKEVFGIMKKNNLTIQHPLGFLYNMVEDRAQERANCMKFPGDIRAMDSLHSILNSRIAKDAAARAAKADLLDPTEDDVAYKLQAAMTIAMRSVVDWLPRTAASLPHVESVIARSYDKTLPDLVGELESEGWVDRIAKVGDELDAFETARALFKRLFPEMPEPPPAGESGKAAARGKAGDGEESDEDALGMGGKIPWELLMRSEHGQREEKGAPCPSSIDWSGKPLSKKIPIWFKKETVETPPSGGGGKHRVIAYPRELINETRRLLQAKSRTKWEREKLDGRLDRRNLTRLVMPQVGDGTYNRSVFQKHIPGLTLDTCVTVLVDSSGSMGGDKFEAATDAAVCLNDMCQVALRVPCEVIGFTHEYHDGPRFWLYKQYSERRLPRDTIMGRMAYARGYLSGNSDGDALMFAAARIKEQRATRKVIIVLSDGCPAEAGNGDADDTLRCAISEIRGGSAGIELYGIGIMDENVRRYYSKDAPVLNDASEVPKALIQVLKDVLQRESK